MDVLLLVSHLQGTSRFRACIHVTRQVFDKSKGVQAKSENRTEIAQPNRGK